ncbi:MAG: ribonuclease HI [Chitinophagales bacterium]|nr:ribonuclease HI [Chitinophagales bacterium]
MTQIVEIYTDGASRGNPGPGGLGVILRTNSKEKRISMGFRKTTNNRMELRAVIVGLEALKKDGLNVIIYSDSKYVTDSINKGWLFNWIKKENFSNKKNEDLWRQFLLSYSKHHVRFIWIKGHADNYYNNLCDELATVAADHGPYYIDKGFIDNKE